MVLVGGVPPKLESEKSPRVRREKDWKGIQVEEEGEAKTCSLESLAHYSGRKQSV